MQNQILPSNLTHCLLNWHAFKQASFSKLLIFPIAVNLLHIFNAHRHQSCLLFLQITPTNSIHPAIIFRTQVKLWDHACNWHCETASNKNLNLQPHGSMPFISLRVWINKHTLWYLLVCHFTSDNTQIVWDTLSKLYHSICFHWTYMLF